jgi:hypothetical protein
MQISTPIGQRRQPGFEKHPCREMLKSERITQAKFFRVGVDMVFADSIEY